MRARPILLALGFVLASLFGAWLLLALPAIVSFAVGALGLFGMLADEAVRARVLNIVRRSLTLCGYTQKSAALTVGMHEADFSKMLNGERKLDETKMARLGEEYERTKAFLTLDELGLPKFARSAVKITSTLPRVRRSA